jgi:hypothetical protein
LFTGQEQKEIHKTLKKKAEKRTPKALCRHFGEGATKPQ